MKASLRCETALGSLMVSAMLGWATPASAQAIPPQGGDAKAAGTATPASSSPSATAAAAQTAPAATAEPIGDIIVTAQRRSESLQRVPIAVTAFTAGALQAQQIKNSSDLQLSLPNVTFTKTNFSGASFTIRGIGDLCVGTSCDQATAIHVNDMPLLQSRLFENEFFDLERIEVLRGPQGTLFGRNATAGVINFITARPELDGVHADGQIEYGNYDSRKLTGMFNLPISDAVGIRVAGTYLRRDGYTRNLFNDTRIDGRDLYALRGTLRIKPTDSTTLDIIGSYFHERDDRMRFQKQLCGADTTGVLGCRPDRLDYGTSNPSAGFGTLLSSQETINLVTRGNPLFANLGLNSIYAPTAVPADANPADPRAVRVDFRPRYYAKNAYVMARLEQRLGDALALTVTGGYNHDQTDLRADMTNRVAASLVGNTGINRLAALAAAPGAAFPGGSNPFAPAAAALFPNGPTRFCVSEPTDALTGIYGGNVAGCAANGGDFDASRTKARQYSIEAHVDSKFDGPFNFLLGGIYLDDQVTNNYFANGFLIDYASGILGAATTLGQRSTGNASYPNVFLAPPFFDGEVSSYRLKSYGLFGELYVQATDRLKLTGGLRYSNDRKRQIARNLTLSFPVPYGITDAAQSPYIGTYDADSSVAGIQPVADTRATSDALTGRFVVDFQLNPRTMVYASYARGYKSAGINPPVPAIFQVPSTFAPESVDAFELGAKATMLGGTLRLNTSAFYYRYKNLQISRLVARTSVNDNTNADIYGAEAEAVISPTRRFQVNLSASYLHTRIKDLSLIDPRDPSGGRTDTVILKDISTGSNCVVRPTTPGNAAGANLLVTAFNRSLGLRAPVAVPGTNTTGAFSVCSALAGTIANPPSALRALFATPSGALPFTVSDGVAVNLRGNALPQSPTYKFSAGAQYKIDLGGGMTLVPRADLTYTGGFYGRVFNTNIDRVQGYEIVNAQIQWNGPENRYFVRGFIQNLTGNNAITGQFLADQAAGLTTNVFLLEPRRYGIAAGFHF
ncbi:TonB-dependent receptor [Sphingomonas abaci]|uniref:Outer membrane receptor protein involved in Fe transport n=1 Tax=Sphingomonas abaci TaxID=237611 RepID=A0A7W7EWQ6_9SPHN|nr:TonB-dependent receptor [Sphingomonas abaci]MBB4616309.1 outer membrane receptor protein involved in Fe transport [Sphingomonas abaci]